MEGLAEAAGHADREEPLKDYCKGLLLPGERKSVEPMAARLAPDNVKQKHQSLHHLVADAPWEDAVLLRQVRDSVLPAMQTHGPMQAWIVDDTGFPKQGKQSVGVARQYCGQLGKQDNCQVAVSLSVATIGSSLPIAWRLYLPEDWAKDKARRKKTKIPIEIEFQTKPKIALEQVRQAVAEQAPQAPVLFDGDLETGLSAFCRGAGIDPRTITPEARGAALQLAGQLLRESVLGLMDLTHSRNEFRNRFRISVPPNDAAESPLNFSGGVDEALVRLLTNPSSRAGSVEAIRDNFKELKAQNSATLAAMRSAFEAFLERVDPKELEERFDRAAKRSVFGTPNKGKYWDLYAEMFSGLAQRPADGFPHLFTEAFAKEYEAKLRTLIPPRRSTFGADRNEPIEPNGKAVGDL